MDKNDYTVALNGTKAGPVMGRDGVGARRIMRRVGPVRAPDEEIPHINSKNG